MDDHTYARTIAIPVNGISGTKFDLSSEEADTLYQNGRKAAEQFFSTWDFEAYRSTYRNGQPPRSRREELHERMKHANEVRGRRKRPHQSPPLPPPLQ